MKAQAVLACCKVLSQQKPREIDKNHTTVKSTACLWTKIWTWDLPNIKQKCYLL